MSYICYSLTASDEPLQVRYIGETGLPLAKRLNIHYSQRYCAKKKAWLLAVKARGARVVITELSRHESEIAALKAEVVWVRFWSQYCDLLNFRFAVNPALLE